MKKISKKNTLSLEKFQIAKLNNLHRIIGGKANNVDSPDSPEEENEETTTGQWTTITKDPTIGG